MAAVLHRTTKEYLPSVSENETDFPQADWIWEPDISAVAGWDSKYWIITGDVVTLMDQAARDAVDAAEAAAALTADREDNKNRLDDERVLSALAIVVKDEINILRAQHSLADRTTAQLKTAIKNEVDNI